MWRRRDPDEAKERERMVATQIERRGVRDARVLEAMRSVPRHEFVPADERDDAYADRALPIGHGATISQPYIVAFMTAAIEIDRHGRRVLEVGTGSGYQSAVLAACGCEVFSIERIAPLSDRAHDALRRTGFADRVHLRVGDGTHGWPERAPFERILVTAAAREVPAHLLAQLRDGGILVAPVGDPEYQEICRYRKRAAGIREERLEGVRFVPLIAEAPDAAGAEEAG
ncbi:MAG: protein-L-isoaspartate(D-aspartate) O-methyltransferase [Gemmatimonadota bacterium]